MKKMSTAAMREANGGGIFDIPSAKCPFCGKKFSGYYIIACLYDYHVSTCSKRKRGPSSTSNWNLLFPYRR